MFGKVIIIVTIIVEVHTSGMVLGDTVRKTYVVDYIWNFVQAFSLP